jgi:pimeloyl-ACP methyl ester carboxylesterase
MVRRSTVGGRSAVELAQNDRPGDAAGRATLLVPGFCSPAEVLRPLGRRLEQRLGRPAHVVSLGTAWGDVRDLAERAHAEAERIFAAQPSVRIDVVGHSLGGLVAAYLLKCLDHGRRVRRVVTLGTPHRGLAIGRAGWLVPGPLGRTLRQLQPGSSLLELIAGLALPKGCELVSIAGLADGVVPLAATLLPERARQRNLVLDEVDHMGLVFAKRAAEALFGALEAPPALRAERRAPPQRRRAVPAPTSLAAPAALA